MQFLFFYHFLSLSLIPVGATIASEVYVKFQLVSVVNEKHPTISSFFRREEGEEESQGLKITLLEFGIACIIL